MAQSSQEDYTPWLELAAEMVNGCTHYRNRAAGPCHSCVATYLYASYRAGWYFATRSPSRPAGGPKSVSSATVVSHVRTPPLEVFVDSGLGGDPVVDPPPANHQK